MGYYGDWKTSGKCEGGGNSFDGNFRMESASISQEIKSKRWSGLVIYLFLSFMLEQCSK